MMQAPFICLCRDSPVVRYTVLWYCADLFGPVWSVLSKLQLPKW